MPKNYPNQQKGCDVCDIIKIFIDCMRKWEHDDPEDHCPCHKPKPCHCPYMKKSKGYQDAWDENEWYEN